MIAFVIIHNMIFEDGRDEGLLNQGWQFEGELIAAQPGCIVRFMIATLTNDFK
jgi:hypothetical protein